MACHTVLYTGQKGSSSPVASNTVFSTDKKCCRSIALTSMASHTVFSTGKKCCRRVAHLSWIVILCCIQVRSVAEE